MKSSASRFVSFRARSAGDQSLFYRFPRNSCRLNPRPIIRHTDDDLIAILLRLQPHLCFTRLPCRLPHPRVLDAVIK